MSGFMAENKRPLLIATIQWYLTTVFQFDRAFFIYDNETAVYIAVKVLYFFSLILFWTFASGIYRKLKDGDIETARQLRIFICYFSILLFILLILWPGTWYHDDLWVLDSAQYYRLDAWQHILTSVYYMLLMQFLPFPGGIILIQLFLCALCVSYMVSRLEGSPEIKVSKHELPDILVKILPFLLPPVLLYQFSGYRMGIYVFLELTWIIMLYCTLRDKKRMDWNHCLLLCGLCVLTSVWRTEAFFYIPMVCLILWTTEKSILNRSMKITSLIILILGFLLLTDIQNKAFYDNNYSVMAVLRPCVELVRSADENDSDLMEDLDKVVRLDVIRNNPGINGEDLYWQYDVVRDGYSEDSYQGFLRAFAMLCMRHPGVFFRERVEVFLDTSGITGREILNVWGGNMYEEGIQSEIQKKTISHDWIANRPVFKDTRRRVMFLLGMIKFDGSSLTPLRLIVINALIPLAVLLFAAGRCIITKQKQNLLLLTAVLIKIVVIFFTEPSTRFMYHLSIYLMGYTYLVWKLILRERKS